MGLVPQAPLVSCHLKILEFSCWYVIICPQPYLIKLYISVYVDDIIITSDDASIV